MVPRPQVLELACSRESDKVFDAGGLPAIMGLLIHHGDHLHKDTMRSCMNVVTRLVPRMDPKDASLDTCVASLSVLLQNKDPQISEPAMKCFVALADRFIRKGKVRVKSEAMSCGYELSSPDRTQPP